MMPIETRNIPADIYEVITARVPILCVDLLIEGPGNRPGNSDFLLLRRRNEPRKGEWWVPGGRVYKMETLTAAVARKAVEETNLSVDIQRLVGYYEDFALRGQCVSFVFLCRPLNTQVALDSKRHVVLDAQSQEWRWGPLPEPLAQELRAQKVGAL